MVLHPTARWILALLTSIGLQVCCCNVKTLLGGCCQDDGSATVLSMAIGDRHHESHHHHGGDDGIGPCDSHPSKGHSQPADPCGPCDHDNGQCACGTHDKAPNLVAKTSAAIPAMGLALPAPPAIFASPLTTSPSRYTGLHAVRLPPTSLLRQHCALIV